MKQLIEASPERIETMFMLLDAGCRSYETIRTKARMSYNTIVRFVRFIGYCNGCKKSISIHKTVCRAPDCLSSTTVHGKLKINKQYEKKDSTTKIEACKVVICSATDAHVDAAIKRFGITRDDIIKFRRAIIKGKCGHYMNPRGVIAAAIYLAIQEKITSGEMEPNPDLTQKEIAELVGTSTPTLHKYMIWYEKHE